MAHLVSKPERQSSISDNNVGAIQMLYIKRGVMLGLASIVIIVASIAWWYFHPANSRDKRTSAAELYTLQTSLAAAINNADNQEVLGITSQLIHGAKSGELTINTHDLAEYHLDRAVSYLNLKEYGKVSTESEAAIKLDSSLELAAWRYELQSKYYLGDRQQLIPLLNQLIQAEQSSSDPIKSSVVAGYQEDITALQHDQGISF